MSSGWGILIGSSEPYNEDIKEIDEQIMRLVQKRKNLAAGGNFIPATEQVQIWQEEFGLSELKIYELIRMLNRSAKRRSFSDFSGELRTVVPIMKQTNTGKFTLKMTHMMQYENWSELHINVRYAESLEEDVSLNLNFTLDIYGKEIQYNVRRGSGSSHSNEAQMQFMVEPPLPDELEGLSFVLVPSEPVFHRSVEVPVLSEPVKFS